MILFASAHGQTKRVVILKVDGLPYDQIGQYVPERDPVTGKSRLPWFDYVFYNNGTRITNFYVRGMSLSAPSWSLVDTGQHLQIKGNVEFDRDTMHTYDYLNALSFYLKQTGRGNVDMPGTEVLDSVGVPVLMDAYDNYQRLPGSQLYGRGARIDTLKNAAESKFLRNPVDLATEFVTGLEMSDAVYSQFERELIARLSDSLRPCATWQWFPAEDDGRSSSGYSRRRRPRGMAGSVAQRNRVVACAAQDAIL